MRKVGIIFVVLLFPAMIIGGCDNDNLSSNKEERVSQLLDRQDKLNEIVESGDISRCNELDMEQYQVSCESNILANEGKKTKPKNKKACDNASSQTVKVACELLLNE